MATLVDSYSESNNNGSWAISGDSWTVQAAGQTFTGNGGVLASAKFQLKKQGTVTGNAYAKIYAHTGTFGTDGIPTGSAIATSEAFDVSTLTTSYALITFTFSGAEKITLTNATKYCVVFHYTDSTGTNYIELGADDSSPSHAGNSVYYYSGWDVDVVDSCFYVYSDDVVTNVTVTDSANSLSFTNPDVTVLAVKNITISDSANSLTISNPSVIVAIEPTVSSSVNSLTITNPDVSIALGPTITDTANELAFTNPDVTVIADANIDDSVTGLVLYNTDVVVSVQRNWGSSTNEETNWNNSVAVTTDWTSHNDSSNTWTPVDTLRQS